MIRTAGVDYKGFLNIALFIIKVNSFYTNLKEKGFSRSIISGEATRHRAFWSDLQVKPPSNFFKSIDRSGIPPQALLCHEFAFSAACAFCYQDAN